jgi:hypothetical protein
MAANAGADLAGSLDPEGSDAGGVLAPLRNATFRH